MIVGGTSRCTSNSLLLVPTSEEKQRRADAELAQKLYEFQAVEERMGNSFKPTSVRFDNFILK